MSKNIDDLRTFLFETLEGLKDGSINPAVANAINTVSKTVIDTAKTEIEFLRVSGSISSAFLEPPKKVPQLQEAAASSPPPATLLVEAADQSPTESRRRGGRARANSTKRQAR